MNGQLTDQFMDTLEQWIGTGPKTFSLLYSITRDGCDASTFNQKCDNQGPTVTVLYNPSKSIYGGYAGVSWASDGGWVGDGSSFLFKLQFNGKDDCTKFSYRGNGYELFHHNGYGPLFGQGHDLRTFKSNISQSGGVFKLDGHINIGDSYNNNGLQAAQINNGNMDVTELEVYKVEGGQRKKNTPTLISPWRKFSVWDKEILEELANSIIDFKPVEKMEMEAARLLMIGPIGAGKSSFYNTINSFFKGRITQRANSGSTEKSLTTAYTPYQVRRENGLALNFRLCDTRGLEGYGRDMNDVEFKYLLDGHMPDLYEFNPNTPFTPFNPWSWRKGFNWKPSIGDQIHCVVFVLDATTLDVLSDDILRKMKGYQAIINKKGIVQTLILTNVDKLCEEVATHISLVFRSKAVEEAVDKAANMLGIPRQNVFPVKNYEHEMDLDVNINILALLSLRQILRYTEDYLDNLVEGMIKKEQQWSSCILI